MPALREGQPPSWMLCYRRSTRGSGMIGADSDRSRMLGALKHRPYLLAAMLVAVAGYLVSGIWLVRPITRALVGWDAGVIVFLLLSLLFMRDVNLDRMKPRACEHDEGGKLIFLLTIVAAVTSVVALVAELSQAKSLPAAALHVGL